MKITKTELEFDEIYRGKVKPIATGGHIPFFKRFIGRVVHVILPKVEEAFWLFGNKEIQLLKDELKKVKFFEPYSKQNKEEIEDALNELKNESFELSSIENIISCFEGQKNISKKAKDLIEKIKKFYSIKL